MHERAAVSDTMRRGAQQISENQHKKVVYFKEGQKGFNEIKSLQAKQIYNY